MKYSIRESRKVVGVTWQSVLLVKRIEEIEGIGLERDLAGLPVVWVPPHILSDDADPDDVKTRNAIITMAQDVRNDMRAALVLPLVYDENSNKLFDFELMSSKGRRNFDTNEIIQRYNRTIAMSSLADFIVIGHESVGSFALASSKTKIFSVAVGSYMDEIAEVFNRHAIPQLLMLNGIEVGENMPTLEHGDIETIDLNELALYIQTLSNVGMDFNGSRILNYLRDQAGIPNEGANNELIREQPQKPFAPGTDFSSEDDTEDDD